MRVEHPFLKKFTDIRSNSIQLVINPLISFKIFSVTNKVVWTMNPKEKMLEIIKNKQGGGKSEQTDTPKNDVKFMRKGPKIYNK